MLETVYGAFDKIARKRRVFKVETIGDCYGTLVQLCLPVRVDATTCTKMIGFSHVYFWPNSVSPLVM